MGEHSKEPTVIKVSVGVALKGHTPSEAYHDRMLMYAHLGRREAEQYYLKESPRYVFNFFACGEIFIPFARETLCRTALEFDCDYVFMVDDDMLTPPDLFYKLVAHKKDIVAALAFTRNPPHNPVIYQTIDGFDEVVKAPYFLTQSVKSYPKDTLVECDAVGFGAVLIDTKVLKKMTRPWFMSTSPTGEDILFCVKARKEGFHVFCDTSVKLGHLSKPMVVTEDVFEEYSRMNDEQREKVYGKFDKYETWKAVQ